VFTIYVYHYHVELSEDHEKIESIDINKVAINVN